MKRSAIRDKRSFSAPHSAPLHADSNTILIVASSGRMLAQSARRAGWTPIVIDLFGDRDTRELALAGQTVETLTEPALAHAIDALSARYEITAAVYGSGLEAHPASVEYLWGRLPVYGNTPHTWRRLHDKRDFFAALDRLSIAYPETRFTPPQTADEWLVKPYRNEGGAQISFCATLTAPDEEFYWQRYQPGATLSVLFLAATQKAQIIGFNRQWTTPMAGRPFAFGGIMNHAKLPAAEKHRIKDWLDALTNEFSLVGLNSLDFIWDGRQIRALEINPRPSASMALYDAFYAEGLLAAHCAAASGAMPQLALQPVPCSAYQIVYAPGDCRIPAALNWPRWAMDTPQADSFIRAGNPICSIIARGNTPRQVWAMLRARQQTLVNTFKIKTQ